MKTLPELIDIVESKGLTFETLADQANWINGFRTAEKIYTKGYEMKLKVKKLHPNATLPVYSTEGAACFDIYALSVNGIRSGSSIVEIGDTALCETGLAFDIPEGYVMLVYSRSGHGFKHNTRLSNCVGVIDSDYTGELMVKLVRDGVEGSTMFVEPGDRIAQAMVIPVIKMEFEEVSELKETERGAKGFGSTGQ